MGQDLERLHAWAVVELVAAPFLGARSYLAAGEAVVKVRFEDRSSLGDGEGVCCRRGEGRVLDGVLFTRHGYGVEVDDASEDMSSAVAQRVGNDYYDLVERSTTIQKKERKRKRRRRRKKTNGGSRLQYL